MSRTFRFGLALTAVVSAALWASQAGAYIDSAPPTLGGLCFDSRNIYYLEVDKANTDHGVVLFKTAKRLRAAKGITDEDAATHVVGRKAADAKIILDWATAPKKTKTAVFFNIQEKPRGEDQEAFGYVYFDNYWYSASYSMNESKVCWRLVKGDPDLLTRFCGTPEELRDAVVAILDNKEVIVPCMSGADKKALAERKGKVQRMRVSLKLRDYNLKRDFVGWGAAEK